MSDNENENAPSSPVAEKRSASETPSRSSKRERKQVERLTPMVEKKELVIPEGKGKKLGDIHDVRMCLDHTPADQLTDLHCVLYSGVGQRAQRKNNIREFSGFAKDENIEHKKEMLAKKTRLQIKNIAEVLGFMATGTKDELVDQVIEFLQKPGNSSKRSNLAVQLAKKEKKKNKKNKKSSSSSSKSKKSASSKKAKKVKSAATVEEPPASPKKAQHFFALDKSDDLKKDHPDISPSELMVKAKELFDALSEDEKKEYLEKEKKDKARYEAQMKKIKEKEESEEEDDDSESEEDSDSDSDDDEPLVPKKPELTKATLKKETLAFLKKSKLEELSNKKVRKAMEEKFNKNMDEYKDFLREVVSEYVANNS